MFDCSYFMSEPNKPKNPGNVSIALHKMEVQYMGVIIIMMMMVVVLMMVMVLVIIIIIMVIMMVMMMIMMMTIMMAMMLRMMMTRRLVLFFRPPPTKNDQVLISVSNSDISKAHTSLTQVCSKSFVRLSSAQMQHWGWNSTYHLNVHV